MVTHAHNEFHISPFAAFYEQLSDTFIDIKRAANSLKRHIPAGAEIFEVGLGTGYFASMFTADGYKVKGIQPRDEMLPILKRKHAEIEVVAECKLEDYRFTEQHETIISHSSAFLFTRHEVSFGHNSEVLVTYVFQSFITDREEVIICLQKTLNALTPRGRLFINIQTNPLSSAMVGSRDDQLIFEMTRCHYFMDLGRVEKTFLLTYRGSTYRVDDIRFCTTYADFANQVSIHGFKAAISEDRNWVIINRVG